MITMNHHLVRAGVIAILLAAVGGAQAFLDEVIVLKQELRAWETTHAMDFGDIVEQLDDLSGPVFGDVADGDWYHPYVSTLAEWGIVSGYRDGDGRPTGEFRPGNPVTVIETLKMAMEAAQVSTMLCTNAPLHPEARGHWGARYVACGEKMSVRLLKAGLATGLNRPAKRAEVLSIVHDVFGEAVPPVYSNFTDTAGHPYEADIAYAALLGIVGGDTDKAGNPVGAFRPDDPINRAETAKVMYAKVRDRVRQEIVAK